MWAGLASPEASLLAVKTLSLPVSSQGRPVCLCPYLLFLEDPLQDWVRPTPKDLILPQSAL